MNDNVGMSISCVREPFGSNYMIGFIFSDFEDLKWSSELYTERNLIEILGRLFIRKHAFDGILTNGSRFIPFSINWNDEYGTWIMKLDYESNQFSFDFSSLLGKIDF